MLIKEKDLIVVSYWEERANSFFSQILGLMFRFKIKKPLIFNIKNKRCGEVHMCFVPFDIDIIFLNDNDIIIETDSLKSWTGKIDYNKNVNTIIEFPKYTIIKKNLKIGDKLLFL
jgi:uncharacterized membrane protein (UPF0127 family)